MLRLLRRFSGGDTQELLKLFRALLILAAAYFVFEVCFAEFAGLFSAVDALKAGNTAFTDDTVLPVATDITGSKSLVFSYVVLALRFAAEVLPTPLILSTSISIPLPVLELCFVLAALLGARLIASNVALAADNDLFI